MTTLSGAEKARFVRTMFDAIARRYDLMNRLMTFGRDGAWRRLAADAVYPEGVDRALDVGAGTGDLSLALARAARGVRVLSLDFSSEMLRLEQHKLEQHTPGRRGDGGQGHPAPPGRVAPVLGDALAVPTAGGAMDAVVTAFTLRNVADVGAAFDETFRVLRPGGRLAVLELTPVRAPLFGPLFRFYFHRLVPLIGGLVSGRGDAYRYLPQSVERFPDAERLAGLLRRSGFGRVSYRKLAAGTVALHVAEKAPPPAPRRVEVLPAAVIRPLVVREVTERSSWNGRLASLPNAHGMQTWEWGELRRETGWETRRLVFERRGVPVAAAAVQRRGLPAPLWGISYCPKGPALDYGDGALFRSVLYLLAEDARRQGSVVLTVEPEAERSRAAVAALRESGYRPSPAQLQSSSTVLVDLNGADDVLLGRMNATRRRYVRKAARDGVAVRRGTAADLPRFHQLYLQTAARDEFVPRPFLYVERLWAQLAPAGIVDLFLAEVDGAVEAALLPMRWGSRAWYLYGATSESAQQTHAMDLLQWETMRWARDLGCTAYDMWGAPDDPEDGDDPLAGVYYYKRQFGGRYVRWVGAYDVALARLPYGLWNEARPRFLAARRRLAARGGMAAR